ncbi:MAG: methyltransferase [Mycobacteriales bacterium]
MLPDPSLLLADAFRVRDALGDAGWSARALEELLGPGYREHLDRGEHAPLVRRAAGRDRLARLVSALVVGAPVGDGVLPDGWVGPDGRALVRLQAVPHGGLDVVVPHDPGNAKASVQAEQVLGVGAASMTLAAATPRQLVGRTLDVGCGAGIQAVLAANHSTSVVATDRNPRAVALTRLAAALNGFEVDARTGDLLDPVQGETFDLVVSNPPFVIGPARRYTYRDAGLEGDEVSRRLVREIPALLAPGGHAVLLVNWLHLEGESGDDRIRSWFDGADCDGWVIQRELAAPEDYVTAWLRDTDEPAFDSLYDEWLSGLKGVEAVAFGVVALHRRTDGLAPDVQLDVVDQPVAATWGEEVIDHFARRVAPGSDLMAQRWRLRADVALHEVSGRGEDGWSVDARWLQQEAGLRWNGVLDPYGAALLAACDGRVPMGALVAVLAASTGLDPDDAVAQITPVIARLVAQGFLVPV